MAKRNNPEAQIQIAIIKWLRLVMPRAIIQHSVNEVSQRGKAGLINVMTNRARGMMPGFPDLIILPESHVGAFFLEVKSAKGRVSPAQQEIHAMLRDRGYPVGVVRSIDDVRDFLQAESIGFTEVRL